MDKGVTKPLYGFYRAKVVENKDKTMVGRVLVYIPDLMPDLEDTKGIWARPANNPLGGRNTQYESDQHYMGTCFIPRKGSYVFIFFEKGNINRPYYFAALDLENAKVLPENQLGENPQDKWTIFKSHEGRTIIISDDPSDARVEITGKKRKLTSPPSGDTASVYTIDENQSTILLDERTGKEKILIRTYKGDYINIDIENRNLNIEFNGDIQIKTKGDLKLSATGSINLKSEEGINIESGSDMNIKSGGNLAYTAASDVNGRAGGNMNHDGSTLNEQGGAATPASGATAASPTGERG